MSIESPEAEAQATLENVKGQIIKHEAEVARLRAVAVDLRTQINESTKELKWFADEEKPRLEKQMADMRAEHETMTAAKLEASQTILEADKVREGHAARQAELDKQEEKLANDHKAKTEELAAREDAVVSRENDATAREDALTARESAFNDKLVQVEAVLSSLKV